MQKTERIVTARQLDFPRRKWRNMIVEVPSRLPDGYKGYVTCDNDGFAIPYDRFDEKTLGHTERGLESLAGRESDGIPNQSD